MEEFKRLRVLHLFANLNLGGAESRIVDLFRTQDQGKVVNDFVIMTSESCYFTEEIIQRGGVIHTITNPRTSMLRNLLDLYLLLRNTPKYDAIHAHTSYYSGFVVFIAFLARVRARVTHARNQSLGSATIFNRILQKTGRFLANTFATKRLAISKDAGNFLYGKANKKSHYEVVSNAFDFQKVINKGESIERKQRTLLSLDRDKINIVLAARFYAVKNHSFLISFCEYLKEKGLPIHLYLIGDGELKADIQQQVENLKLDTQVTFLGLRNDVQSILHNFDIMVMPSISEGLGVAALEAQTAGLPCLLSEGIPLEVDLGLGLCHFVSLEDDFEKWQQIFQRALSTDCPSKYLIEQKLYECGYDLASTRERYYDAYTAK